MFSKRIIIFFLLSASVSLCSAQELAIKSNFLYTATTTLNATIEIALSDKTSLDLSAGFNPFTFKHNARLKHVIIQPEMRFWRCETFAGSFFGVHAHLAQFNAGGINFPLGRLRVLKDSRYEGYLYGAGVSYGHHWYLSDRLNLEAGIGAGYARIHYDKYPCNNCGTRIDKGRANYLGLTKASLSIIYLIK